MERFVWSWGKADLPAERPDLIAPTAWRWEVRFWPCRRGGN